MSEEKAATEAKPQAGALVETTATNRWSTGVLADVLRDFPEDIWFPSDRSREALRKCLLTVESLLAKICSRHSRFFLLFALRSAIPPSKLMRLSLIPMFGLYPLRVLTLAALKYGSPVAADVDTSVPPEVNLRWRDSDMPDLAELLDLAGCYYWLSLLWNGLGWGCEISIHSRELVWRANEELNRLMTLDGARRERNVRNLLSVAGALDWLDLTPRMEPLRVLVAQPLHEQIEGFHLERFYGERSFHVDYAIVPCDLATFHEAISAYPRGLAEEYGLSPEEIVCCLAALSDCQTDGNMRDPVMLQGLFRTGLGIFPRDRLVSFLVPAVTRHYKSLTGHVMIQSAFLLTRRFLDRIMLDETDYRSIILHGGWAPGSLYWLKDRVVVDWAMMQYLLGNVLSMVSSQPGVRNIKGKRYEDDVADWIEKRVPDLQPLFPPRKKLRLDRTTIAEIDLSYQRGGVGYLIDCKAYSVSRECARGDERELRNRWSYIESWLAHAGTAAKRVAETPIGDNYAIPREVAYLVPIVCSPYVEPCFSGDEWHLLTPEMPRACTPLELAQALSGPEIPGIRAKPYTFTVNHDP